MAQSVLGGITPYFVYLLLVSTIGPLLYGYHLAELNAPEQVLRCEKNSIGLTASLPQCIKMDDSQFGLVSSIFTLGGLLGAVSVGPIAARRGRFQAMLGTTVFFFVGSVFEALANNIGALSIGRFISGLGAGAALVVVPIYISEIAPPGGKGFFGAFTQVMINFGILATQLLGLFLSRDQLWRIILGVAGGLAALQAVGLALGGQESPKWLADNGRASHAKNVLRIIRGGNADIEEEVQGWGLQSHEQIEDEEQSLLRNDDSGEQQDESIREEAASAKEAIDKQALTVISVFKDAKARPAVFAVMVCMLAQQLCGINSIIMYGVKLLSSLLAANSALLNVGVAVLNIIVTIACAPLADKLGRKICLLLSIAGMGSSSLVLAIAYANHVPVLSAVAVLSFVASFAVGLGPIPFILSSELVNSEAVGATQSWALVANWISTFVVAQFFPIVNSALGGGKVYYIFAAVALFFWLVIAWCVPETKGKADADEVWGRTKASQRED